MQKTAAFIVKATVGGVSIGVEPRMILGEKKKTPRNLPALNH